MRRLLLARVAAIAIIGTWAASCSTMDSLTSTKQAAAKPVTPAPQASTQSTEDISDQAKVDVPALAANLDSEIARAKQQRVAGDLNGAAHTLSQLMLVAPDDPRVVSEYGKVMVSRGHSDDAIAFLKRGLELQPDDWTLYSAIGIAYDQKNDYADAKTAYDRALQIRPGNPAVLNNYAMSRMLAGDLHAAQSLIAQAQATGGADPKIVHNVELMAALANVPANAPSPAPAASNASKVPASGPVTVQTASGPVMMQAVPKDTPKPAAAPKALAAKPADETPSLRTAAD
jgi:Flp pilus assembly protein TadD